MKIELELPDELVKDLYSKSSERGVSLAAYATELVYQLLAHDKLGEEGKIENRPDWQAALERSRADFAAGRVVPHDEVEKWHLSRPASSGPKPQ
jgi:predicted transcriptional regulator